MESKLKNLFGNRVVDKSLARDEAFFRLPRYVAEYLIAKYVKGSGDIEKLKSNIKNHLPDFDRIELIKHKLMTDGTYTVIDRVDVRTDLNKEIHWAVVPCISDRYVRISEEIIEKNPGLLAGGMWGTIKMIFDPGQVKPVEIINFTPFQVDVTSISDIIEARKEFSTEEWIELLLSSCGYKNFEHKRTRYLVLSRLLPLVERNINLIELGPRQTGKTFLLRNTSPHVFVISGGKATPANLFVNLTSRTVGILGIRKVVVFDEIAATSFGDAESTISVLKDYMESGQFSRGSQTYASEASLFLAGNIDVAGNKPHPRYRHLFEVLPDCLKDAAFIDRLHGYIPGWEIPKITRDGLSTDTGFVTDFFGEHLIKLRDLEFRGELKQHVKENLTQRDLVAIEKITSGMIKLIHPDGEYSAEELDYIVSLAVEMRQRVHDQLVKMAPGEFSEKCLTISS